MGTERGQTEPTPSEPAVEPVLTGAALIGREVALAPVGPGVYRMLGLDGEVLYVGKARSVKKRVASYCHVLRLSTRIRRMVNETRSLEFVTTHTEAEALLLEANLIKRYGPRYNILLRDDKSFPQILIARDHSFPQVLKHRGARKRKGDYFGPFASAWAVNETLTILQRAFLLRSCADTVFESRTRPCLLYQIKRCSAPCVGKIGPEDYAGLVKDAKAFLGGDGESINGDLARHMEEASERLDFETAAQFRDRISALAKVLSRQDINLRGVEAADVIALHSAGGQSCIQVFFFRSGRNFGNRAYYMGHDRDDTEARILEAFIGQFYSNLPPPPCLFLSHRLAQPGLIEEALTVLAGQTVRVSTPERGAKRKLVLHALSNAEEALGRRMAESATQRRLLDGVAKLFELDSAPNRIEVYDNSHISGSQAVGAMIVAGPEGLMKSAYRRFTIRGAAADASAEASTEAGADAAPAPIPADAPPAETVVATEKAALAAGFAPGDDYGMMREVLTRRFARALKEDPDRQLGQWPDLVLIDGGPGHLGEAQRVFAELGVAGVALAAIAKGPDRNAGRESIYRPDRAPLALDHQDPVLFFLQRLRDEAHRFAIGAHRGKRGKSVSRSSLDEIPGIGAKRKRALLHHFGSALAVTRAGRDDLARVEGIDRSMADKIYDWFHAGR
ncbi:MAG: excinuclease ABC subunit UvrC [Rhodospirillales bacterium]|nr:excinuclease ABC subunit UvrC [Rhodospirillales bacterium]